MASLILTAGLQGRSCCGINCRFVLHFLLVQYIELVFELYTISKFYRVDCCPAGTRIRSNSKSSIRIWTLFGIYGMFCVSNVFIPSVADGHFDSLRYPDILLHRRYTVFGTAKDLTLGKLIMITFKENYTAIITSISQT